MARQALLAGGGPWPSAGVVEAGGDDEVGGEEQDALEPVGLAVLDDGVDDDHRPAANIISYIRYGNGERTERREREKEREREIGRASCRERVSQYV